MSEPQTSPSTEGIACVITINVNGTANMQWDYQYSYHRAWVETLVSMLLDRADVEPADEMGPMK